MELKNHFDWRVQQSPNYLKGKNRCLPRSRQYSSMLYAIVTFIWSQKPTISIMGKLNIRMFLRWKCTTEYHLWAHRLRNVWGGQNFFALKLTSVDPSLHPIGHFHSHCYWCCQQAPFHGCDNNPFGDFLVVLYSVSKWSLGTFSNSSIEVLEVSYRVAWRFLADVFLPALTRNFSVITPWVRNMKLLYCQRSRTLLMAPYMNSPDETVLAIGAEKIPTEVVARKACAVAHQIFYGDIGIHVVIEKFQFRNVGWWLLVNETLLSLRRTPSKPDVKALLQLPMANKC